MDFGFSDEQDMLREASRRFLDSEMPVTRVRSMLEDDGPGYDPDCWRKAAALGWFGILVPEQHGGAGQSLVDAVVVAEELGRTVQPGPYLPTMVASMAIAEFGTAEQQASILPSVADGSTVLAWSAPPGFGDALDNAITVRAVGDELILDGATSLVQDAHVADQLLLTARDGDGLCQVLVPARSPGLDIRVLKTLDLARRLCAVELDGVRVPSSARLGVGDATEAADRQVAAALVLQCAEAVGGAERLLEMTVAYAKDRVQFGRPIGSFQAIKHKCANMLVWVEASKSATYYAALAVQDRLPETSLAASIAKSYVGQAYPDVAGEALQIHGGIGFTWEHDVHLYLRRAKSNEVLLGDPAWHRERICQLVGV